jgi:hypothetical protein
MGLLIVAYSLNEIPGLAGAPPACKKVRHELSTEMIAHASVSDRKVTPN